MRDVTGVTGLPCSGKSYVAGLLASGAVTGVPADLVKADDLGHAVLLRPEVGDRLREGLGDAVIVSGDPAETRRRIAAVVFADPERLEWLEGVVHPLVREETERIIAAAAGPVVVEAALLLAAGMERQCDRVLLIEADFAVRLARAERRGWDRSELERRDRRLLPLFSVERLRASPTPVIRIANDADDDGLAARLAGALRRQ